MVLFMNLIGWVVGDGVCGRGEICDVWLLLKILKDCVGFSCLGYFLMIVKLVVFWCYCYVFSFIC